MESQDEKDEIIRKYLLDQLDEASAEKLDEKLLAEPDFFEIVSVIEQELLDDFVAGRLGAEESARVDFFYQSSEANKKKLDFARAIRGIQVSRTTTQTVEPKTILTASLSDNSIKPESAVSNKTDYTPQNISQSPFTTLWGFLTPYFLIPATTVLIIGIALWIWYPFSSSRTSIENELISLNQGDRNAAGQFSGRIIDLNLESDPGRSVGTATQEIKVDENSDQLISFKLPLLNRRTELYRVDFSDNQGRELFSVPNLKTQTGADGVTLVQVFIPSRFLRAGDFKINLRGQDKDGALVESEKFSFRVVKK